MLVLLAMWNCNQLHSCSVFRFVLDPQKLVCNICTILKYCYEIYLYLFSRISESHSKNQFWKALIQNVCPKYCNESRADFYHHRHPFFALVYRLVNDDTLLGSGAIARQCLWSMKWRTFYCFCSKFGHTCEIEWNFLWCIEIPKQRSDWFIRIFLGLSDICL